VGAAVRTSRRQQGHLPGILFALLVACGCVRSTPPRIQLPPFAGSQPDVAALVAWGDGIVALVEGQAFLFSSEDQEFKAFEPGGCTAVVGITMAGSQPVVLCRSVDGLEILHPDGRRALSRRVPLAVGAGAMGFAGSAGHVSVATAEGIAVGSLESGVWKTSDVPPAIREEMGRGPLDLLMEDHYLWLACNRGEFGGALYRIDLSRGLESLERVRTMNVVGMASDSQGRTWVAGGLSHLGLQVAQLVRFDGADEEVLVDERAIGRGAAFSAFTLLEDTPLLLDAETGLHEFRDGRLQPLARGSLTIEHSRTQRGPDGDEIEIIESYRPTDAVGQDDGTLYVAMGSAGVLAITFAEERAEVRSLGFR